LLLNSERTTAGAADSKISNQPVAFKSNLIGMVRFEFESNLEASQVPTFYVSTTVITISNCEIRNRTELSALQLLTSSVADDCNSSAIIARSEPEMDHRRALRAAIRGPPADWKRPRGRPRQTWTRIVENDLKLGLHTAWRRAQDRADWRNFVKTATLHYRGMLLMMMMMYRLGANPQNRKHAATQRLRISVDKCYGHQ